MECLTRLDLERVLSVKLDVRKTATLLLNQEYSFTITKRLPSTTHRKDRAVFTENTLESPLLSQSRHDLVFKGNLRLQINQNSTSNRRVKRFRERHAKDDPVRKIQASKQPLPQ